MAYYVLMCCYETAHSLMLVIPKTLLSVHVVSTICTICTLSQRLHQLLPRLPVRWLPVHLGMSVLFKPAVAALFAYCHIFSHILASWIVDIREYNVPVLINVPCVQFEVGLLI